MRTPRILIAGTHSGVGKSTVSMGIMAAFRANGLIVQGFKVGPDYIDPSYHTAITGRPSRNLDSWMLTKETVLDVFSSASVDADISIIEGVMGFYDGKDPLSIEGSTAEISLLLQCPVVLVIDASGMARSAAAVVKGYQSLDPRVQIAAVIANRVGGEGHFRLIQSAVEQSCGVAVVGYLTSRPGIHVPERHLGLIPAIERGDHTHLIEQLSGMVTSSVSLDTLLSIANTAPDIELPVHPLMVKVAPSEPSNRVRIAIARDAAFNFYYEENLELLKRYGAELVFFRPLDGEKIPDDVDGLYIGGGFPEEFAAKLSSNVEVTQQFRSKIDGGLPTYAECGGFMYLTEALTDVQGQTHPMVGIIPAHVTMQTRLSGFGYREMTGGEGNWLLKPGQIARGHEFHYSSVEYRLPTSNAYEATGTTPVPLNGEGYLKDNVIAGYTHLHFSSNHANG